MLEAPTPRLLAVIAVVALLILTGFAAQACGGGSPEKKISGDVLLRQPDQVWKVDQPCAGAGDFADLKEGADVVVKDATGKVIGTSSLEKGSAQEDEPSQTAGADTHDCSLPFSVGSLPIADSYSVQVSNRGAQTYSQNDLEGSFWNVRIREGS